MKDKAKQLVEWIAQMDSSGFYFSDATKQLFDDLYVSVMYENRFPPQMYPDKISSQERGSLITASLYNENAEPCPDCGSVKNTHVCLMHKRGWQSDGQIGSPGAKI